MVVINSATFGDEFSSTDVLKSLQDKLASSGSIKVPVDSSLIPVVTRTTGAGTVTLTNQEQTDIKDKAAEICGPSDQTCLEIKTQELAQQKLKEKETETIASANIVKGRRLTVTYTDENGKQQTAIIPEGQTFALGADAKPDPSFDYDAATSPWRQAISSVWGIVGTSVVAFLYATSLIITWMTFTELGNKIVRVIAMAVAVFLPMSGFGLSFAGAMFPEYFRGDRLLRARISKE